MPFKSDRQRRYLYAVKPSVAKEFAEKEKALKRRNRKVKGKKKHGRR